MRSNIPIYLQNAWKLYNCTEALLSSLWETYQDDFLEHYFPEITGDPPLPQHMESDFEDLDEDEDIPF